MKYSLVFLFVFSFSNYKSYGQSPSEFDNWNRISKWDQKSAWEHYIIKTPGFMGPNALPIPYLRDFDYQNIQIKAFGEAHFSNSEYTLNPYLDISLPFSRLFRINLVYRPMEYYFHQASIRDERKARNEALTGFSTGDLYINSTVLILNQKKHKLDLDLGASFKTATGKNLANARHTNSMAYTFDATIRKEILSLNSATTLSGLINGGLFVWQTGVAQQNDALTFGAASLLKGKASELAIAYQMYKGWFGTGDFPQIMRIDFNQKIKERGDLLIGYTYGIQNHIANQIRLGYVFKFSAVRLR